MGAPCHGLCISVTDSRIRRIIFLNYPHQNLANFTAPPKLTIQMCRLLLNEHLQRVLRRYRMGDADFGNNQTSQACDDSAHGSEDEPSQELGVCSVGEQR